MASPTVSPHRPARSNGHGSPTEPTPDTVDIDQLLAELHTQAQGLSQAESERRLAESGPNELPEEELHPLRRLLGYFWGPIPWMIEAAALLSALVAHWADLGIISALLVVNAGVGFWEEYQAGNAIAALKEQLALTARALRDGSWTSLPARDLVPGDIIRIRIGDIIPADAHLLPCDPVQIDQSALTGESLPVTHGVGDLLYAGAVVKQGEAEAVVSATGSDTYFAHTASLVEGVQTVSHFQQAILKIGDYLIGLALALVTVILIVALFRGDDMLTTLEFALVLTVAAVPVAMPTVLSVTMAVGARLLAARQAIVSRLASIEELAGVDVLCSDKTGTLTLNQLTVGDPYVIDGTSLQDLLASAAWASRSEDGDPIDAAILSASEGSSPGEGTVTHFQPFDPVSKRTEATVRSQTGETWRVAKGAPQVIMGLCPPDSERDRAAIQAIDQFAARGFRSLGVARTDQDDSWQLLGIIPLFDPPRPDSKTTLETARAMGVSVKMVTGDQVAIGRETARQLGLGTRILDAGIFQEAPAQQQVPLEETIETADGFGQVFPEHKYNIVDSLQHRGHIVGMTGDGVNDAPALKKADAGVAVAGATDAARAAADIVLTRPGLSIIIEAIEESRKIFRRMNSYAIYRIAETIRVLLFMTLSILVFNFYPVTPVMIVLLALLNDGAILSIAYDRVSASRRPEAWDMRRVLGIATTLGIAGVISTFGLFYIGERVFHLSQPTIQSLMYLKLSVAGHLTIFITRTRGPLWSSRPSGILLGAVGATQAIATLISVYGFLVAPIGWNWALLVWVYALAWMLVNDRIKLGAYRLLDKEPSGFWRHPRHRAAA
jgi:H+-transporting ATPase